MLTPRLHIEIRGRRLPAFQVFGGAGCLGSLATALYLTYATGLALWPVLLCALVGFGLLFALAYSFKMVFGWERLVYYHYEIAILTGCAALLLLLRQPVLQYLDIVLIAIGIVDVLGRVGCFSAGCCHGRPFAHGVIYSAEHVNEGFPAHYEGVAIFPIQLVECVSVFVIILGCGYAILSGSTPGTALLIYSVVYGVVRFGLELIRGDTERPYWRGFSEAQWTSLAIVVLSAALAGAGLLPPYDWHRWTAVGLVCWMAWLAAARHFARVPAHAILRPRHVAEIARGVDALESGAATSEGVAIFSTSLGLRISKGACELADRVIDHYTVSGPIAEAKRHIRLNTGTAKLLAELLQALRHPRAAYEVRQDYPGIFHIVFTRRKTAAA